MPSDRDESVKALDGTWRVGRKIGRTIYQGDTLIGVMDTRELAAEVVAARQELARARRHLTAMLEAWDEPLDDERERMEAARAFLLAAPSVAAQSAEPPNMATITNTAKGQAKPTHYGNWGYAAEPIRGGIIHDPHCCASRGCHKVCSHLCGTELATHGCCGDVVPFCRHGYRDCALCGNSPSPIPPPDALAEARDRNPVTFIPTGRGPRRGPKESE